MVVRPASAVVEVLVCVTLYLASCCGTGGTAHDVVLLLFDIMLNIIIVVVIFTISTIERIAATITIAIQPS